MVDIKIKKTYNNKNFSKGDLLYINGQDENSIYLLTDITERGLTVLRFYMNTVTKYVDQSLSLFTKCPTGTQLILTQQ